MSPESSIAVLRRRNDGRAALTTMESAALGALYRRYGRGMLGVATRVLRNGVDAEDVVQDVFTRLPTAIVKYRDGNFGGWLAQVTTRVALMRIRAASRRPDNTDLESADLSTASDSTITTVDDADLRTLVDRLPDSLRAVVALRYFGGLSHDQIATRLGITSIASQIRLCRALKRLRLAMKGRESRRHSLPHDHYPPSEALS